MAKAAKKDYVRIAPRVTEEEKALIKWAAALQNITLTVFISKAPLAAANVAIQAGENNGTR